MKMTAVSRVMRVMVIFKLKAEISQIQMLSEDPSSINLLL